MLVQYLLFQENTRAIFCNILTYKIVVFLGGRLTYQGF